MLNNGCDNLPANTQAVIGIAMVMKEAKTVIHIKESTANLS